MVDEDVLMEDPYAGLSTHSRGGVVGGLEALVQDEILHEIIFARISASLRRWNPSSLLRDNARGNNKSSILNREALPHAWIVPWLPHLDGHRSMLTALLPDVKRRLKSALAFLSKGRLATSNDGTGGEDGKGVPRNVRDREDEAFLRASLGLLSPWARILDGKSLRGLTSEGVVLSRLGRYLSRMTVASPAVPSSAHSAEEGATGTSSTSLAAEPRQDWTGINLLFDFYGGGMLSEVEFLSLVEGEVVAGWIASFHSWMLVAAKQSAAASAEPSQNGEGDDNKRVIAGAARWYAAWKAKFFFPPPSDGPAAPSDLKPWEVLRVDEAVCRHFYAALLMIEAVVKGNDGDASKAADALETLDVLAPPPRDASNFRSALARRARENRRKEEEEERRQTASSARSRADSSKESAAAAGARRAAAAADAATFREVAEDFARQNDVVFRPKTGPNSMKDGRPVFLFGTVPIYLEGNVAFALRGKRWMPTHLEDIVLAGV